MTTLIKEIKEGKEHQNWTIKKSQERKTAGKGQNTGQMCFGNQIPCEGIRLGKVGSKPIFKFRNLVGKSV